MGSLRPRPPVPRPSPHNPELSAEKQKQSFPGFDFSEEGELQREEKQELQRMRGVHRREVNLGVVAAEPLGVLQRLAGALGAQVPETAGEVMDLVVGERGATVYKCWVVRSERREDLLAGLYLHRCQWVEDEDAVGRRGRAGEDIEWLLEILRLNKH